MNVGLTDENYEALSQYRQQRAFAYQISPLCIEMGGKRVRFFAELGYGNEGVASIGISTRL